MVNGIEEKKKIFLKYICLNKLVVIRGTSNTKLPQTISLAYYYYYFLSYLRPHEARGADGPGLDPLQGGADPHHGPGRILALLTYIIILCYFHCI